jgi:superfamily II DNA or RNA helicase
MNLRPYQQKSVEHIELNWFFEIRKVLLWAPTGSGKGHILAEIIRHNTGRVLFIVRGRELVKQGSRRVADVPHGVMMAGYPITNERVQIVSIDTMVSRGIYPPADLIIIDEAHLCGCDTYREMARHYPTTNFLSVTATPYTRAPLDHVADVIVSTTSIEDLIDQGFLVPPMYYAKHTPDLSAVEIAAGEFNQGQLATAMMKSEIYGDAVVEWRELAQNRPTLGFCTSVKHSKAMAEAFNAAGISSEHMDANTPDDIRAGIMERSRCGATKVVWNVGILTTGVDLPWISCIIDLAPTLSLIRNDQKLGRGTRPFAGKTNFIILDHAGNIKRHGDIRDQRDATIHGKPAKAVGEAPIRTCPECYAVIAISLKICPFCQASLVEDPKLRTHKVIDGRLVPIVREKKPLDPYARHRKVMANRYRTAYQKKFKRGWVYHQLLKQYGKDIANKLYVRKNTQWVDQSDFAGAD